MAKTLPFQRDANLIGGEWVGADSGESIEVTNPATGEVLGSVPKCGAAETRRAIAAAQNSFESWSRTTAAERAEKLRRLAAAIEKNKEDLAVLLTSEQGKPLAEARGEIAISAAYVQWFAEEGGGSMGIRSPRHGRAVASSSPRSRSASSAPSRRGTSPPPCCRASSARRWPPAAPW